MIIGTGLYALATIQTLTLTLGVIVINIGVGLNTPVNAIIVR